MTRPPASPPGLGVRQSSGAFAWDGRGVKFICSLVRRAGKSGIGLPQSKTLRERLERLGIRVRAVEGRQANLQALAEQILEAEQPREQRFEGLGQLARGYRRLDDFEQARLLLHPEPAGFFGSLPEP